jgi:hypothetical protein
VYQRGRFVSSGQDGGRLGCAFGIEAGVVEGWVRATLPVREIRGAGEGRRILPASLLFVKLDERTPAQMDFLLDVAESEGVGETGFRFRLQDAGAMPKGRAMAYLVAGDQVAGPCAFVG